MLRVLPPHCGDRDAQSWRGCDAAKERGWFQIRDARTGALVSARQSDLRIGADYSWNRGVPALINNSLLSNP